MSDYKEYKLKKFIDICKKQKPYENMIQILNRSILKKESDVNKKMDGLL